MRHLVLLCRQIFIFRNSSRVDETCLHSLRPGPRSPLCYLPFLWYDVPKTYTCSTLSKGVYLSGWKGKPSLFLDKAFFKAFDISSARSPLRHQDRAGPKAHTGSDTDASQIYTDRSPRISGQQTWLDYVKYHISHPEQCKRPRNCNCVPGPLRDHA